MLEKEFPFLIDYSSRWHIKKLKDILIKDYGISEENALILSRDCYLKIYESETSTKRKSRKNKEEKKNKNMITSAIMLISQGEIEVIAKEIKKVYDEVGKDRDKVVGKFKIDNKSLRGGVNSSLFGRMFASNHTLSIKSTVQRAHMISTHSVDNNRNIDNFTAMDELLEGGQGSAHMDDKTFHAGSCMYKCFIIDINEMIDKDHLGALHEMNPDFNIENFIKKVIKELILALPNGKKNSFSAKVSPSFVLINIVENNHPLSYANAFAETVKRDDKCMENSIERLVEMYKNNEQWVDGYSLSLVWVNTKYNVDGILKGSGIEEKEHKINNLIDKLIKKINIGE